MVVVSWLVLLSAAVLVGLIAQPGAAVNVPQPVVVSSNPADWTPHVLDGRVAAIVQIGNKIVAGGQFTQIESLAAAPDGLHEFAGGSFTRINGVAPEEPGQVAP